MLRQLARPEPNYNGVPLRTLVLQAAHDNAAHDNAESTTSRLRSLDTNAIPFLIEWIRYEPPSWRPYLTRAVNRTWRGPAGLRLGTWILSTRKWDLVIGSLAAFEALGTNAAPAIPALATLMNDRSAPITSCNAMAALRDMGPYCLPAFTELARAPHHPLRFDAMNNIRSILNNPRITVAPSLSNAIVQAVPELLTNAPSQ
jgi:hypothetical protein